MALHIKYMLSHFVLLLLFINQICVTSGIYGGRFVASVETTVDGNVFHSYSKEFPYMVEIVRFGAHHCGGGLIREDLVLTAAHCLYVNTTPHNFEEFMLLAGNQIRESVDDPMTQIRYIKLVEKHPTYDVDGIQYDIAIVQADNKFILNDYVQLVNLPFGYDKNSFLGATVVSIGWGLRNPNQLSDVLLSIEGYVMKSRGCIRKMINKTHEHLGLCIREFNKGVICLGDSGGPVVLHNADNPAKDILLGTPASVFAVGDGNPCLADSGFAIPNLASFTDWINNTITTYF